MSTSQLLAGNVAMDGPIINSGNEGRRKTPSLTRLSDPLPGVIGTSPAMREVFYLTRLAAPSQASVLITGETGTGKELIAKAIHELSSRLSGPYIRINCGALHENLLESELFGHIKGSFTGAIENKIGRFEAAHGGTIFLDEVNSMSPNLQVKLLRVLQEGQFERVGDSKTLKVDVRVIAASNELLQPKIATGKFREDLFYRLNVVPIFLPPLRSRREDIEPLSRFFLAKASKLNGIAIPELTAELLKELQNSDWHGNVRELENAIERIVVLSQGGRSPLELLKLGQPRFPFRNQIENSAEDLPTLIQKTIRRAVELEGEEGALYDHLIAMIERELISHVMTITEGVQSKAAKLLGLSRNTLHRKLGEADSAEKEPEWII